MTTVRGRLEEVISTLSCVVSLFQLQKLRRPKWEQGFWLLYADSLYWRSAWELKEATTWAKGLFYFTIDKKETQQRRRGICWSHLSSLPGLDLWFLLQTFFSKLSILLSLASSSFVWALGTFPYQMLSHLDMQLLLSWQTDLWEFDARAWDQLIPRMHDVLRCCMFCTML